LPEKLRMATLALDMSDTFLPAVLPSAGQVESNRQGDRIASYVHSALTAVQPARRFAERRREKRYPYPYPLHLTPLDADGFPDAERTFVVIGKHLSERGIDFYCSRPLPERRVVASLDSASGWVGLVLELAWCRFNRHGWYDNGGRFLAVVRSPLLDLDQHSRVA
jgi:hypothetical protein